MTRVSGLFNNRFQEPAEVPCQRRLDIRSDAGQTASRGGLQTTFASDV
jgi:hypothetical protein